MRATIPSTGKLKTPVLILVILIDVLNGIRGSSMSDFKIEFNAGALFTNKELGA